MTKKTLKHRVTFWLLIRKINWIGNHALKNGYQLTIWRESDKMLHATLGEKEAEE